VVEVAEAASAVPRSSLPTFRILVAPSV